MRRALLLATSLFAACSGDAGDPADSVVLIVIDTLRADHLGAYGYQLETSPTIDRLANEGAVFEAHTTQCNSTHPSMVSILTSLFPKSHRNYLPVPIDGAASDARAFDTMAEIFSDAGYYTAAVWSHPLWGDLRGSSPVFRGWDACSVLDDEVAARMRHFTGNADRTNERLAEVLAAYDEDGEGRPLFLWLHYFDPHTPYDPPIELANTLSRPHFEQAECLHVFDRLTEIAPPDRDLWIKGNVESGAGLSKAVIANGRGLYDASVAFMDTRIDEALGWLDERGVYDDALVCVLADHGENLGEGGSPERRELAFSHERLYEGVVRTPLIVRMPGSVAPARIEALSQNVDLLPTLLELTGVRGAGEADPSWDGSSLLPLLRGDASDVHERVYSESSDHAELALRDRRWKYIDPGDGGDPLLFDWRGDQEELEDLAGEASHAPALEHFRSASRAFRPPDVWWLSCAPGDEPYRALVRLDAGGSKIVTTLGDGAVELSGDATAFDAELAVEELPMRLGVVLEDPRSDLTWRVELRDAEGGLAERLYTGTVLASRTSVYPLFETAGDAAADLPVRIDLRADELELAVAGAADERVALELRYREPRFRREFTVRESSGFRPLRKLGGPGNARGLRGSIVNEPLGATIGFEEGLELAWLLRIDGTWPALDGLALNGSAVRRDALGLYLPYPRDPRIEAALITGPPADAPGSICLWLEGGGEVEIDTSTLDDETARQLEALGY